MKWLILSWALTAAYVPLNMDAVHEPGQHVARAVVPEDTIAVQLDVGLLAWGFLKFSGSTECYMVPNASFASFIPFRQDYCAGVALIFGPLEIGVKHECDHFVEAPVYQTWFSKGETQIYAQLKAQIEF